MLDRRRLAATASALAASFAAVLAIGAFAGRSPAHQATVRPVTLTISATATRMDLVRSRPVSVLRIPSLTRATSGDLRAGRLQVSVPAGAYLVCISQPSGLMEAGRAVINVIKLPHWACLSRVLRTGGAKVRFTLSGAAAGNPVSTP
jgi:hypothetical protein